MKSKVHFEEPALEAALGDYFHEVEHAAARILRLEKALDEAIGKAPAQLRAVVEAMQALRGVAQLTAATIVSEIGSFSRFEPRTLMGYSGLVASEHSSGGKNIPDCGILIQKKRPRTRFPVRGLNCLSLRPNNGGLDENGRYVYR